MNQQASQVVVQIKNLKNPIKSKTQKPTGLGFFKKQVFLNPDYYYYYYYYYYYLFCILI